MRIVGEIGRNPKKSKAHIPKLSFDEKKRHLLFQIQNIRRVQDVGIGEMPVRTRQTNANNSLLEMP